MKLTRAQFFASIAAIFGAKALPAAKPPEIDCPARSWPDDYITKYRGAQYHRFFE
jgi:hypothetical protein